jgi:methylmalonyl-CoA mutase N-terminal domain/subunit
LLRVDPFVESEQVARLTRLKLERDNDSVRASLARIAEAAKGTENVMPPILAAVENYATLGEIVTTLTDLWGRHQEVVVV